MIIDSFSKAMHDYLFLRGLYALQIKDGLSIKGSCFNAKIDKFTTCPVKTAKRNVSTPVE